MPDVTLDFRNTNTLWGSVLVETLARCGVQRAVISPGSRSTPLALACVRHAAIECTPALDERSAAFFALGAAKRTHTPVVLVCTSGTAGANFLPAVIEARESSAPLIVITADRPPEMRECTSGQTIDQQKLFGSFVSFYHELAAPEARLEMLRYLRQTVMHAFERALLPQPGPVHLNAPFRDPLAPLDDAVARTMREQIDPDFFTHVLPPPPRVSAAIAWQRPTTSRGLIVAGPANPREPERCIERLRRFAEALHWPILADALSPLRHYGGFNVPIVTAYDAILRDAKAARDLAPRYVVCAGGWPTSKVLRSWLEQSQAEILLVAEGAANRDALHGRTRHIPLPADCMMADGSGAADPTYADAWARAQKAAAANLAGILSERDPTTFEGAVTWHLSQLLPLDTPVFVASSMPVRDVEYFWPLTERRVRLYFNRGANGIDGTLSTALGIAQAGDQPAVLLTGDLALLHDSNGFLLRSKFRGSLTIVLINNRGGGIFEHLPIAQFDPPFEEFFATPQDVDFATLCAAHGVSHELVRDREHFAAAIANLPASGIRVLEVRTDRKRDAADRKRLLNGAGSAAGRAL